MGVLFKSLRINLLWWKWCFHFFCLLVAIFHCLIELSGYQITCFDCSAPLQLLCCILQSVVFSMQDSFGRVSEKNKEALKMSKHITKLFPNKVTIEPPQVCHLCYIYLEIFFCKFLTLKICYRMKKNSPSGNSYWIVTLKFLRRRLMFWKCNL